MPAFTSADPNAFFGLSLKQTALGTPNVAPAGFRFMKYLAGTNFKPTMDVIDLREGGDGLDWGSSYKKTQKGTGQLIFNMRPEMSAQVFAFMPGGATWDGGSVPAVHTFHTGHASFPYATMQIAHPGTDLFHFLSDVRFTGLTLEGISGEPWKITAPFTAINYGASAAIVAATYGVATLTDGYYLYYNTPSYAVNGAIDTTISSFKVDLALGVDELQAQSLFLDDVAIMNRDANIEVVRRYQNSYEWRRIVYGATGNVGATTPVATGSFEAIVSVGGSYQARVYAPLVTWRDNVLTDLDPDGKTIYETITGKILKGATHAVHYNIRNGHASTY